MKTVLIVILGAVLATLAACQTDVTGPPPAAPNSTLENSPDNMHRNVEQGDVYLEENIDRYDLDRE
jgi:hypothetical protein